MFTRDDVRQLKLALPAMPFAAAPADHLLLRKYLQFYGLEFGSGSIPVTHHFGSFDSKPFLLAGHHFCLPPEHRRGTVFIVHGYYDHSGLYAHLIRHCLQNYLSVVIYDLPGHGLSSGEPASIKSFDQYTHSLRNFLRLAEAAGIDRPWHLIGQSTGAAVIVDHLLDNDMEFRHIAEDSILMAPLLRPRAWRMSLLSYHFLSLFMKQTRRKFTLNSHNQEFLDFLRFQDPLQAHFLQTDWVRALIDYQGKFAAAAPVSTRLHIVQGTDDTTVDWEYNLSRLGEKFPNTRSYVITQARHHLVNEAPEYRQQAFDILNEIFRHWI